MDRPSTKARHDIQGSTCKKTLIVFTVGRTGSSWLCIGLYKIGIGVPMEYFHTNHRVDLNTRGVGKLQRTEEELHNYIATLEKVRTTQNGIFGTKIHNHQWMKSLSFSGEEVLKDREKYIRSLSTAFTNPHFVFLYREDLLEQSISMYIAGESQAWSSEKPKKKEVAYNFGGIYKTLQFISDGIQRCKWIEKNIQCPKMVVTYEELESDYNGILQKIADFVDVKVEIPVDIANASISKQRSPERTRLWKNKFLKDFEQR